MNSAIHLIKHIKLENRGSTQEKNSLQYGKHKGSSATAHATHQEKNGTVRRSERTGLAPRFLDLRIFILNSKILKFLFVCLFFRNFASLEQ